MIRAARLHVVLTFMRGLVLAAAAMVAATGAGAQDAGAAARAAAAALDRAGMQLSQADRASDRVAALTATVRAYEDGLTALRDGLRDASVREAALRRDLEAREAEVAALLGALQTLGRADIAQQLLHPDGPVGAARSGMLVAAVTPGLASRAQSLARDLEEVATLRQLQENAANTLRDGLDGVQRARAGLSQAVADRTDLPRRFTEDAVKTAILISATETLEGFASGLTQITEGDVAPDTTGTGLAKGALPLPVAGRVLRRAGEADAAGVARPGIVLATRPEALVTTPAAATIRYVGPLLDYGLVAILEPRADLLIVLAGLETLYGEAGQVLPEGAPVGLMGGGGANTSLLQSGEGGGNTRPETLYIEVREGDAPVDPLAWFTTDKG